MKMHNGLLLPKWQPWLSFQQMIFWPLSDVRWPWGWICHRRVKFSSTGSFGAITLSTYWCVIKYVKKPKTSNNKNMVESWMCDQHQLLGVPAGGQLLLLSPCAKAGLNGRLFENPSTFFSLVPRSKEKMYICKMFIFYFLKIDNYHFPKVLPQKQLHF